MAIFVALITCCGQIFVCFIFVGQATHENLSPTKISLFTVMTVTKYSCVHPQSYLMQLIISNTTPKACVSIKQNHAFDKYCCSACLASGKVHEYQTPGAGALLTDQKLQPVSCLLFVEAVANLVTMNGT